MFITSPSQLGLAQWCQLWNLSLTQDLFCPEQLVALKVAQRSSSLKLNFDSDSFYLEKLRILRILSPYLDFEVAKKIHVIGGCCRFLTGVWHPDIDLDMVTGLWYTHMQNFGSLSWFWRCKEHPCPSSSDLGLWMMLEVSDWGLAS